MAPTKLCPSAASWVNTGGFQVRQPLSIHLRRRLFEARLQAAEHFLGHGPASLRGRDDAVRWRKDVDAVIGVNATKVARQHPTTTASAASMRITADHVRIAIEQPVPEAIADHDDLRARRPGSGRRRR